jgi:glycerol-3-phosphate dehydrogenase subunit B
MAKLTTHSADVLIIGAGLSGMAAASFAVSRGLKTAMVGWTRGEIPFASGLFDLLSVYPVDRRNQLDDPWRGIEELIHDCPDHPYGRAGLKNLRVAWREFLSFLNDAGMYYTGCSDDRNAALATAAGTLKRTWRMPETMWPGVDGMLEKRPTLVIDFDGMKEFSAVQIAEVLKSRWPELRAKRLTFPYPFSGIDRHTPMMAEALESPKVRIDLAEMIRKSAAGFELIALPAILGARQPRIVASHLEEMIGVPVFEIPTLPPSVPGQRLVSAIDQALERKGVTLLLNRRVTGIEHDASRCLRALVSDERSGEVVEAAGFIIATGRFIGGGLTADFSGVREPLMNLPVHQPAKREEWHREHFLDPEGHPLNRCGVSIDTYFRPLGQNGRTAFENLFAAGSLLAHQDWVREKSGAGIAVATAFSAVQSFIQCCR